MSDGNPDYWRPGLDLDGWFTIVPNRSTAISLHRRPS